ncbi:hypothetical protein ACVC7V_22675 [Hydrogenophaga sp. A37]|uniref:hypothetical protein n=1 Tax=Hydrogenophaga sp. A37 TaxID=1945864 RepID=UPI00117B9C07|nr:hypothetical protein [Hydrogenophaga sp. A37]
MATTNDVRTWNVSRSGACDREAGREKNWSMQQPTKGALDRSERLDIAAVGARWRYDPIIVAPGSRKAPPAAVLPARFPTRP